MGNNSILYKRGFTLIEILIVIVIIGIISGLSIYALGDFGASRKATVTAEHFKSYLALLQQRAILEARSFGISVQPTGIQTYALDETLHWVPMSNKSFFHWQAFPSRVVVSSSKGGSWSAAHPAIIINPSGNMTPFQLFFGTTNNPKLINVSGKNNGEIIYRKSP